MELKQYNPFVAKTKPTPLPMTKTKPKPTLSLMEKFGEPRAKPFVSRE